jgi:cardiolipin synthase
MRKFPAIKIIPFLFVFSNLSVSAQNAYNAEADEARLKDFQIKIAKTAEGLGVSVYEDFPVYAGSGKRNLSAAYTTTAKASSGVIMPMPALPPSPVKAPPGMTLPEPMSHLGNAVTIWHALGAQLGDLGIPFTNSAPSFEEISKRVYAIVRNTSFASRKSGRPSLFTEAGFIKEFETVTGSKFTNGNCVRFLVDGESFKVKDALIKGAKKSLLISTWAFYDDITGYEAAQMLIEKKKQGIEIKIILDNKIVYSHGAKVIKMMQDAGIELIRYEDSERSGDYWHVKMMIVDDQYAIVGGMNFGDVYSHKNPDFFKWRDTDALYSGPAALESRRIFARIWNAKLREMRLPFGLVAAESDVRSQESGSAKVALVLQDPPKTSPILVSIIKAMYGATRNINIENAYVVAIPVVTQAILDARARGVEVNLLTNSMESIDPEGKSIVDAMAQCLIPFVQSGVNVYLKRGTGDTLHSKFMTVDGVFVSIGSYNIHPRGERSDTELNLNILDTGAVAQLDEVFKRDISVASKITSVKELEKKPGLVSRIMSQFFYSQLSPGI